MMELFLLGGEIIREMNVYRDKKFQETVEADANMLCKPKQIYNRLTIAIILFHI